MSQTGVPIYVMGVSHPLQGIDVVVHLYHGVLLIFVFIVFPECRK